MMPLLMHSEVSDYEDYPWIPDLQAKNLPRNLPWNPILMPR